LLDQAAEAARRAAHGVVTERFQLRQQGVQDPSLGQTVQYVLGSRHQRTTQLVGEALLGHRAEQPRHQSSDRRGGVRVQPEAGQVSLEAQRPQHAQRVFGEALVRVTDAADLAGGEVVEAVVEVVEARAELPVRAQAQLDVERVDREVAAAEVLDHV
jgi:hypothetical protein